MIGVWAINIALFPLLFAFPFFFFPFGFLFFLCLARRFICIACFWRVRTSSTWILLVFLSPCALLCSNYCSSDWITSDFTSLDLREDKQFFVEHPGAVPITTAQVSFMLPLLVKPFSGHDTTSYCVVCALINCAKWQPDFLISCSRERSWKSWLELLLTLNVVLRPNRCCYIVLYHHLSSCKLLQLYHQ